MSKLEYMMILRILGEKDDNYELLGLNEKNYAIVTLKNDEISDGEILKLKNLYNIKIIKDKYNKKYLIESKEGLIFFLLKLKNKYKAINLKSEIEKKILEVNKELLKEVLPILTSNNKSSLYNILEEFDKSINPFYDGNIEKINDIGNDKKINFQAIKEKNEVLTCQIHIMDQKSKSTLSFYQGGSDRYYRLDYIKSNSEFIIVEHFKEEEEKVVFKIIKDRNVESKIFNLTTKKVGTFKMTDEIKKEDMEYLRKVLEEAIILAQDILSNKENLQLVRK